MNIPNNVKTIIYVILAILVVGGVAFAISKGHDKKATEYTMSEIKSLSTEKQKKILEAQIRDFESQAKSLSKGVGEKADKDFDVAKYRIYIKLADAQNFLERYQDALNSLNNIPDSQKTNPTVYRAYAIAYKGVGQTDKAVESVKNAIAEGDTSSETWLTYLEISKDLPNDQLKALYLQAIAATKSNVDIMVSYAHFSEKIGDKATAIAAWETARNVNPDKASEYEAEIARLK